MTVWLEEINDMLYQCRRFETGNILRIPKNPFNKFLYDDGEHDFPPTQYDLPYLIVSIDYRAAEAFDRLTLHCINTCNDQASVL